LYTFFFLLVFTFFACLVLTPVVRGFSIRLGWVDQPGERKIHSRPIPRTGGIAILAACAIALWVLSFLPSKASLLVSSDIGLLYQLAPGVIFIALVGLLDDVRNLRPWIKLSGQAIASLIVWTMGVSLNTVAGVAIPDSLSCPITVLWLLACTNSFNLIDGLDGLATGLGLFATVTVCIASFQQNNLLLMLATAPLAGALLGFLRYNFNPATIFLGDSGSMMIGFTLGCFGAIWTQKAATLLGLVAPIMALSIPFADTLIAIARRLLRGAPVFAADRHHIHHVLLSKGLTPRQAVLILYGVCGLGAAFSLLQNAFSQRFGWAILALFLGVSCLGISRLGYREFSLAGKLTLGGALQELVRSNLALQNLQVALTTATTREERWDMLCSSAGEYGIQALEWGRGNETRNWSSSDHGSNMLAGTEPRWAAVVPIGKETMRVAFGNARTHSQHIPVEVFAAIQAAFGPDSQKRPVL
jgi:UDP-GlcNAc:undecaprenyl-phosphate GlcNAc-1-phosphate transferase